MTLAAPGTALLIAFTVLPCIVVAVLSLYDWNALRGTGRFVGLQNFRRMLHNDALQSTTIRTAIYTAVTVPLTVTIGLLLALGVHTVKRAGALWRTAFLMPMAATLAATSVVWRWMFFPNDGVIDSTVGRALGLQDWLNSTTLALPAIGVVGCWQSIGATVVMFLAGLATVPTAPRDAAVLDGANSWHRFWSVTWPALGPATVFAVVITMRDALQVFDAVRVMTDGGPLESSETLSFLMWKRGVSYLDVGGASVVSLVLLGLVLAATFIQARTIGRRWESAGTR